MKITELLFLNVIDQDGRALGHVLDLRCRPKPETNESDVWEFVYGWGGLLERLGLKKITRERIAWQSVVRVEGKTLVIAATGRKEAKRKSKRAKAG